MKEIHTEVPYSKRCEFCVSRSQPGIAILYAENQVAPTFSVRACAKCFGKLIHGDHIPDIFGWSWSISDGMVVAEIDWALIQSWDYRDTQAEITETLGVTPTRETRDLVRDLSRAVQEYHLGLHTMRPFAQTYGRDEALLFRAMSWLGEDSEKGVPNE